jgi:DNA repair protein RecO (recombination protein O)
MNELLLKLTHRDDPHEGLFAAYDDAVHALRASGAQVEPVLRRFEVTLLRELGYAVELAREAANGAPIVAERDYWYVVERGPVRAPEGEETPGNAVKLRGLTLIDLERGRYEDPTTVAQSKQLMRLLINHSLGGAELATRRLVRDLQGLQASTVANPAEGEP